MLKILAIIACVMTLNVSCKKEEAPATPAAVETTPAPEATPEAAPAAEGEAAPAAESH